MSMPHAVAATADELPIGSTICEGRFTIEAILGRGGVATVYRVATEGERSLAVKVMLEDRAQDPDQRDRFDNEGRILEGLGEVPYVPGFVGRGHLQSPDRRPYIAMELSQGPTLDRLLRGQRVAAHTRVRRACTVVRNVADALADLHSRGVIHRDIKPSNIAVEGDAVRLLDFGYAHSAGDGELPSTAGLTMVEHRPGTYLYMAPEQALGQAPGPSFDVYALAVTLFEALAGRAPFQDLPPSEMARLKCEPKEPEISIAGRVFGLPSDLEELVDHGLRRLPGERIASAAELRDQLDTVLAKLPIGDDESPRHDLVVTAPAPSDWQDSPPIDEPANTRPPRAGVVAVPPRRRPLVPVLALSFALAVLAWFAWRWSVDPAAVGEPVDAAGASMTETAETSPMVVDHHTSSSAPPMKDDVAAVSPANDTDSEETGQLEAETSALPPTASTTNDDGVSTPTTPLPRPCEDVEGQAEDASDARRWSQVLRLTKSRRCWKSSPHRLRLRAHALSEMGRYAECARLGRSTSDPSVRRTAKHCDNQLDPRGSQQ